uniref:Uncharacterized protein n=1 Tax=Anguilla anguilla TaxID=7936 RepID=A0A0E9RE85_ANGAN
MIQPDLKQV